MCCKLALQGKDQFLPEVRGWPGAGEGAGMCGRGKWESRLTLMEKLQPGLGPCLDLLLLLATEVSP